MDEIRQMSITGIVPRYPWVVVKADHYFEQVQIGIDLREKSDHALNIEDMFQAWNEAAVPFLID